jgi:hypothetical protein
MTTTIPNQRPKEPDQEDEWEIDEFGIYRPTWEQWDAYIQRWLDELGLTREQLAQQAETGEFQNLSAHMLWFEIG